VSKPIRVEDHVYEELDKLRGKSETFSEVIAGLLSARRSMLEMITILQGQLKYHEWQRKQLEKILANQ